MTKRNSEVSYEALRWAKVKEEGDPSREAELSTDWREGNVTEVSAESAPKGFRIRMTN